jgi:hypothetical protein
LRSICSIIYYGKLLIAGSNDHIVPLKVAEAMLEKYNKGASGDGVDDMGGGEGLVEYNEFGGGRTILLGRRGGRRWRIMRWSWRRGI